MNTTNPNERNLQSYATSAINKIQEILLGNVPKEENATQVNKVTSINIETEHVNATASNNGRSIMDWATFLKVSSPQKTTPSNQRNWCPLSYIPGYSSTQPQPVKPPPIAYKPEIRNPGVRLVMYVVLVMFLATAGFVTCVLMTPEVKKFFKDSGWTLLLPALAILIMLDYSITCSRRTRKSSCKSIILILAVAAMSFLCATISAHFHTEVVLYTILATAAVIVACVSLACYNFNFTKWMLFVIMLATALSMIMVEVLAVKMVTGTMMNLAVLVILIISTILQCSFLIIQLQAILTGQEEQLNDSDYALGAFTIYISPIHIFLKMLQCSMKKSEE